MSLEKLSGNFNKKQVQVLKYDKIYKPHTTLLEGAVRSGKTFILIFLWLNHVLQFKNKNYKFIMTGFTSGTLKQNVLDDINEFFGLNCDLDKNNRFKLFGNTICCFGASDTGSFKAIRGMTSHGWFANELTLQHQNTIEECLNRCSGTGARVFADTNPDHPKHPIKLEWVDKDGEMFSDGTVQLKSWHFEIFDNAEKNGGFIDDKYIEARMDKMPDGYKKDRAIWGKWTAADGVIFTSFRESMVIEEMPAFKYYIGGIDWGYDHFGTIMVFGVDHDGSVYLIDEVAAREKEIDWWNNERKKLQKKYKGLSFYADTARPEYVRKVGATKAKKDVIEGIELVQQYMKDGKFFVKKHATHLFMQEIYSYVWDDKNKKEQPKKENDDAMDAVRYALYTHFRGRKTARAGKRIF